MNELQDHASPVSGALPAGRGALLRAAREAAGISREEVAARLRLSQRQVQALEDDEVDALPPGPFVKGFVRNYARLLGREVTDFEPLPASAAAAAATPLPSLTPPQPSRQVLLESGRASANRRWLVAAVVFLALGVLGSWLRMEHIRSASELIARQAQPSLAQLGALVGGHQDAAAPAAASTPAAAAAPDAGTAAPAPVAPADDHRQPTVAPAAPPAATAAASASPAATAAASAGASPPAAPATPAKGIDLAGATALAGHPAPVAEHAAPPVAPPATQAAAGPGRKLALDFDADCWVEVRDENNQVLWSGTSRAGEHRDIEAHGPVRIVVGNAPATRLSWNGRPVDLAEFTRLTVARLTLDPASDNP